MNKIICIISLLFFAKSILANKYLEPQKNRGYHKHQIDLNQFLSLQTRNFRRMDRNANGQITDDELKHPLAKRILEEVDTDQNGKVTKAEFDKGAANKFKEMDTNKDGFLTRKEQKNERKRMKFKIMDSNQDGQISMEEFMTFKKPHHHKPHRNKPRKSNHIKN